MSPVIATTVIFMALLNWLIWFGVFDQPNLFQPVTWSVTAVLVMLGMFVDET
jgi:hypothetical protein